MKKPCLYNLDIPFGHLEILVGKTDLFFEQLLHEDTSSSLSNRLKVPVKGLWVTWVGASAEPHVRCQHKSRYQQFLALWFSSLMLR